MLIMKVLLVNGSAYYLKCIEAGEEKGVKPPAIEKITFTNFIR